MIVDEILDQLDTTREKMLIAISELPDEALMQENVIGKFSIADVLVNLTVWEAELVTGLMRLDQGKKPGKLLAAMSDRKSYNQKRYRENQGRDLDRIFDDLQQVRVQLEGWLESFSEKSLADKKRYKFFNGRSLAQIIEEVTFKNEAKYIPMIVSFVNAQQES